MNSMQEKIIAFLSNKAIVAGSISNPVFAPYDMDVVLENLDGLPKDIADAINKLAAKAFVIYIPTVNKNGIIKLTANGFEFFCEEISRNKLGF